MSKKVTFDLYSNCSILDFGVNISGHLLASAATNGAVVLWNLNKSSRSKQGMFTLETQTTTSRHTQSKVCLHWRRKQQQVVTLKARYVYPGDANNNKSSHSKQGMFTLETQTTTSRHAQSKVCLPWRRKQQQVVTLKARYVYPGDTNNNKSSHSKQGMFTLETQKQQVDMLKARYVYPGDTNNNKSSRSKQGMFTLETQTTTSRHAQSKVCLPWRRKQQVDMLKARYVYPGDTKTTSRHAQSKVCLHWRPKQQQVITLKARYVYPGDTNNNKSSRSKQGMFTLETQTTSRHAQSKVCLPWRRKQQVVTLKARYVYPGDTNNNKSSHSKQGMFTLETQTTTSHHAQSKVCLPWRHKQQQVVTLKARYVYPGDANNKSTCSKQGMFTLETQTTSRHAQSKVCLPWRRKQQQVVTLKARYVYPGDANNEF